MQIESLIERAEAAPPDWKDVVFGADCRLHQLAPYIGKLKPIIARQLLEALTLPGDTVLDCFSGSGTIPLEALLLGRKVLAYDANPYAVTLTRAKLEAPASIEEARERLSMRLAAAARRPVCAPADVPEWVRKFFHPDTLRDALSFADECIESDDQFLLACLLSILHHQRPGFLSYPSSHLIPYLRDRKFPKENFPDLYGARALEPRLLAKINRTYKDIPEIDRSGVLQVGRVSVFDLQVDRPIDAVVTSPPYMNALDYVRDNRLRMWFLDRNTANYSPEPTEKLDQSDAITVAFARNALKRLRTGGRCILIVGETVLRKRVTSHPAERMLDRLTAEYSDLHLERIIRDEIPDVRRSRRTSGATKRELILVLQKR
ncbi:DNA methyltransferase [Rhodopseudomonas palustris]|uniref:DNA methyltransferase n=1 Tax=Rhodopseudomonas palustris TaxID=1076 RepID=UPI001402CEB2|nr:DNA methyltransferase [Rhodopseudomonas palustris]QLH72035.1 RsmD family RNA methyltransferase [Rhodopseudomonas palustris]